MADIRTTQNTTFPAVAVTLTWALSPTGAFDTRYSLATAIIIAFGTEGLAAVDDPLPDPNSHDRKGWWGDLDADVIWNGWAVGSKLWLLKRAKITDSASKFGATATRVENYIRQALQPFITAKIISDFEMIVTRNAYNRQRIDALVTVYRGPQSPIALQFQVLWDELGLSIKLM